MKGSYGFLKKHEVITRATMKGSAFRVLRTWAFGYRHTVNPKKLETGLRTNSGDSPYITLKD